MLVVEILAAGVLPIIAVIGLVEVIGWLFKLIDKEEFKRIQKKGRS